MIFLAFIILLFLSYFATFFFTIILLPFCKSALMLMMRSFFTSSNIMAGR